MVNFAFKSWSHLTGALDIFFHIYRKESRVCVSCNHRRTRYFILFNLHYVYDMKLLCVQFSKNFMRKRTFFSFLLNFVCMQWFWNLKNRTKYHNMSVYDSWMNLYNVFMTGKKTSHKCRVYGFIDTINLNWFSFIGFYNMWKKCCIIFHGTKCTRYDGKTKMHLSKSLTFDWSVMCYNVWYRAAVRSYKF